MRLSVLSLVNLRLPLCVQFTAEKAWVVVFIAAPKPLHESVADVLGDVPRME